MTTRAGACPNCGAEITFRWSGAVQTTCPACRSILVRHDVDLQRVGQAADVPESVSGIQLGTEGSFKKKAFTVVGRIIYRYELGHWNEWHLRFADDTSAWLSDAQAEYAVTRQTKAVVPGAVAVGEQVVIHNKTLTATSVTRAHYAGVEGELPFEYWDKADVEFIDLRGPGDELATIDWSEDPPLVFVGEFEDFAELRLRNLREDAGVAAGAPSTRSLSCASCGAAIELRTGLAQTVACAACGAVMDARDDGLRVLLETQRQIGKVVPDLALGSSGTLKGKRWTVIGYQIRAITVDGDEYSWREYLLWNAEGGFRFLTEYEGHWNDVVTAKGLPKELAAVNGQPSVEYLGTRFKHFQHAKAKTKFVLGEFPWEVRVGDEVLNDDFVAAPLMLSRETTGDEITWSLGTYTSPAVIEAAFKPEAPLRKPRGVFANQPNPSGGSPASVGKLFGMFVLALVLLFVVRLATARNERVFDGGFRFDPATGDTAAFVTKVFELQGHTSNVALSIQTDLQNDDAYFNVALLPEGGGKGYELGREVGYYFGTDSDGRWAEGRQGDKVVIASVAPGRYYLRIEPEHAGLKPVSYTVGLRRDVPRVWPFGLAILVLAVGPALTFGISQHFEAQRWAESDYAPETGGDDEE